MDAHEVILADRDSRLGEWSTTELKEGLAACHMEFTRLQKEPEPKQAFRLAELQQALDGVRSEMASQKSTKQWRISTALSVLAVILVVIGLLRPRQPDSGLPATSTSQPLPSVRTQESASVGLTRPSTQSVETPKQSPPPLESLPKQAPKN